MDEEGKVIFMIKRIILHWTAGRYYPTQFEKQYYHYLVDKDGRIYEGIFKPEDNNNCSDGKYAQHTGGGNTGSIGVALCSMYGFKSRQNAGQFPVLQFSSNQVLSFVQDLRTNIR